MTKVRLLNAAAASAKETVLAGELYEPIPPPPDPELGELMQPESVVDRSQVSWDRRWTRAYYRTEPSPPVGGLGGTGVAGPALQDENRGSGGELVIPPTIYALLGARIDRLAPEERTVIDEPASVEGRLFHRGAVSALLRDGEAGSLSTQLMTLPVARPRRKSPTPKRCSTPGTITQQEFDSLKAKALSQT